MAFYDQAFGVRGLHDNWPNIILSYMTQGPIQADDRHDRDTRFAQTVDRNCSQHRHSFNTA